MARFSVCTPLPKPVDPHKEIKEWTNRVMEYECAEIGKATIPINWRVSTRRFGTSGVCFSDHISVTLGSNKTDQVYGILHEIAHHLVGLKYHHDITFWKECFRLCIKYGVPIEWTKRRALNYKVRAASAAVRSMEI